MTETQSVFFCTHCTGQHPWGVCPLEGLCVFCKKRPATLHFGDMLSFTHGGAENCCELCCVGQQLAHARERAAALPELEARFAKLLAADGSKKSS